MKEVRSLFSTRAFDLVLLNRLMQGEDGVALVRQARQVYKDSVIVMRSPETPWSLAEEVQSNGGNGLFATSIAFPSLIDALEDLLKNPERFIFVGDRVSGERIDTLTLSEREVLSQLSAGLTTKEIAKKRHNSEATIKSHLTSIYRKLGVRNRVEAVAQLYQ